MEEGEAAASVVSWLYQVATQYDYQVHNLFYHFVDDDEILAINRRYLKHDYVTDIITFDYSNGPKLNAEFFICWPQVQRQAADLGEPVPRELCRVIVHGLLHLCGFDDQLEDAARKMREEEEKVLTFAPLKILGLR